MGTVPNSENADEKPHNMAFNQGLCYSPKQIDTQRKHTIFSEIIIYDSSVYTMDHPDFDS